VLGFENRKRKAPQKTDPANVASELSCEQSSARRRLHPYDGQANVMEAKAPVCYICVMKGYEAISRLLQHEANLKRLGVEHLYMFGSTARDEAGDDSDVDLFFDHEKGKLGLFELMDVKERAASILGGKTDIMTRNSLHSRLRTRIEEVRETRRERPRVRIILSRIPTDGRSKTVRPTSCRMIDA